MEFLGMSKTKDPTVIDPFIQLNETREKRKMI